MSRIIVEVESATPEAVGEIYDRISASVRSSTDRPLIEVVVKGLVVVDPTPEVLERIGRAPKEPARAP